MVPWCGLNEPSVLSMATRMFGPTPGAPEAALTSGAGPLLDPRTVVATVSVVSMYCVGRDASVPNPPRPLVKFSDQSLRNWGGWLVPLAMASVIRSVHVPASAAA